MSQKISIIIPVLNESRILRSTLGRLRITDNEELIVVDGGSSDETTSIASEYTGKVYTARSGRAHVMNHGAQKASGDILLFLHADCVLPDRAFHLIRDLLKDRRTVAGAFSLRVDAPDLRFRAIEMGTRIRSRLTRLLYGDQAMFLRKETFDSIGGFAPIPLMEDIEITQRLRGKGEIVFLRQQVTVSARRWLAEGALYTTLRDWMNVVLYSVLKVSPERLIKYYRDVR